MESHVLHLDLSLASLLRCQTVFAFLGSDFTSFRYTRCRSDFSFLLVCTRALLAVLVRGEADFRGCFWCDKRSRIADLFTLSVAPSLYPPSRCRMLEWQGGSNDPMCAGMRPRRISLVFRDVTRM